MSVKTYGIGSRVDHREYGEGIIYENDGNTYMISFLKGGTRQIAKAYDGLELMEEITNESEKVHVYDVEEKLEAILREWLGIQEEIELGEKWHGGTLILQPKDPSLKPKEIPIETFFHKIVMVRDRLRVLEQNINSHKGLTDEDKIHLQQYVTRIYGSLTSFNVLFKYSIDHFKGEGKS